MPDLNFSVAAEDTRKKGSGTRRKCKGRKIIVSDDTGVVPGAAENLLHHYRRGPLLVFVATTLTTPASAPPSMAPAAYNDPILDEEIDLSDLDYSVIEQRYAIDEYAGLDDVIVISGLPIVGPSKQERLFGAIVKRFKAFKIDLDPSKFDMPLEEGGAEPKSKGYVLRRLDAPLCTDLCVFQVGLR